MNNEIDIIVNQMQKLIEQLENDYTELHNYLQGDIFHAYVEVVQDEIAVMEKIKKNMIDYQRNNLK